MSEPVNEPIESDVQTDETTSGATPDAAPEEAAAAAVTDDADDDADADDDTESDDPSAESDDSEGRPGRRERLEQEGDIAADYLEELLEITDLDGDLDMDVEGDRATVSIVGANLPQLVGPQGEVLEALQELTRLAVYRETGERSRLMLDVSGHRAARRTALEVQATEIVAQVKESGERASLEPMSPFERKVVHDVVAAAGLKSESEGTEPRRYVVVLPG
ncbi:MAG: single-stranded DNA-binding protein [Nocardioides sp.]|nr:single-stranded DNA-binding protein [Nocardioides sp.]